MIIGGCEDNEDQHVGRSSQRRSRSVVGRVRRAPDRIRPRFGRHEPARHAAGMMQGLLAGLERKNCWTIAEHLGHRDPEALQNLLSRAKWDDDGAGDDLLAYVLDAFSDPAGILVIDETGDLKKGT